MTDARGDRALRIDGGSRPRIVASVKTRGAAMPAAPLPRRCGSAGRDSEGGEGRCARGARSAPALRSLAGLLRAWSTNQLVSGSTGTTRMTDPHGASRDSSRSGPAPTPTKGPLLAARVCSNGPETCVRQSRRHEGRWRSAGLAEARRGAEPRASRESPQRHRLV